MLQIRLIPYLPKVFGQTGQRIHYRPRSDISFPLIKLFSDYWQVVKWSCKKFRSMVMNYTVPIFTMNMAKIFLIVHRNKHCGFLSELPRWCDSNVTPPPLPHPTHTYTPLPHSQYMYLCFLWICGYFNSSVKTAFISETPTIHNIHFHDNKQKYFFLDTPL